MKAYLFDLDGTLADTDRDIREAWKATLADLGLECPHFDREFVAGPPIDEMTRILFPALCTAELTAAIRRGFGEHYDHDGFPHTVEYPGVMAAVRRLKAAGVGVYVATNKRYAGALGIARKFGWERVFDGIYAGDMYPGERLKKAELLRRLMAERGIAAAEATMIGDTAGDFRAARENGIASVAVTWGYGTAAELELADRRVSSPAEI